MKDVPILTRSCILCEEDNYEVLFTYTYDFLAKVRNISTVLLKEIGWTENTTSSIVKCKKCRSIYVRDVFLNIEERKPEYTEEHAADLNNIYNSKSKYYRRTHCLWVLCNLIAHTSSSIDNIKLLDYGAGIGSWCNAARALGIANVFAYEPYNSYHPRFYEKYNFPGIVASRSWEDIEKQGPFDLVVCTSVFEHLSDPKKDMSRLYDNMATGGHFYINQPFMNLPKELNTLKQAQKIVKKMPISHYHPGHVNYLTNLQFRLFLEKFGFKILSIKKNPLAPYKKDILSQFKKTISPLLPLLIAIGVYRPWEFILKKN